MLGAQCFINDRSSYASNFEEIVGAYWFWVVRASIRQKQCMLEF